MSFELTEQIQRHLTEDPIAWLTTVTAGGNPVPRPIWFIWDGTTIEIYSLNTAARLANIRANRHVSLHFNSAADGNDVVTIAGVAEAVAGQVPLSKNSAYVTKYAARMRQFDIEAVDRDYDIIIRVVPKSAWCVPA